MNLQEDSLYDALITTAAFGIKYVAAYPPTSVGGQQFSLISAAIKQAETLGAAQFSGAGQKHSGVMTKATARHLVHDDMLGINRAAHSLTLLGTPDLTGKFLMPHSNGDVALLNAANAFATDAVPFTAAMVSVGQHADFITHLTDDIAAFQAAKAVKGTGAGTEAHATGGLADALHQAVIALHILQVIVPSVFKNDPAKLAEWVVASHVERHTPVKRVTPPAPTPPAP
jgi:hypothetical protein